MLSNDNVHDGFKPRKQRERKPRAPVTYQHVNDFAGRVFLLVVMFVAEDLFRGDTSHLMTRDFKSAGLTQNKLLAGVLARVPDYKSYYESKSGRILKAKLVYDRWHKKSGYTNCIGKGAGTPAPSREHYLASPILRSRVEVVEARYRKGPVVIPLAEMQELGK